MLVEDPKKLPASAPTVPPPEPADTTAVEDPKKLTKMLVEDPKELPASAPTVPPPEPADRTSDEEVSTATTSTKFILVYGLLL